MKQKGTWKRNLAWTLILAMMMGNHSSIAYAGEITAETLQSADMSAEETDISENSTDSGKIENQEIVESTWDETDDSAADFTPETVMPEPETEIAADEAAETDNATTEPAVEETDSVQSEIAATAAEEPELIIGSMETAADATEGTAKIAAASIDFDSIAIPGNAEELTGGDNITIDLSGADQWYRFTPKKDGFYIISMDGDTHWEGLVVELYVKNDDQITSFKSDDGKLIYDEEFEEYTYYLPYSYESGKEYYLRFYSEGGTEYTGRFYERSGLTSIALEAPSDSVLVSGVHNMADAYRAVKVTLTYKDGKSDTIEGISDDDFCTYAYGIRITDADEDGTVSPGEHTIKVSAPEWNCEATTSVTFLSMKEAANNQDLTHPTKFVGGSIAAGFQPTQSGHYRISASSPELIYIVVYDVDSSKIVLDCAEAGVDHYNVLDAKAGKTYLIVTDFLDEIVGNVEISVKKLREKELTLDQPCEATSEDEFTFRPAGSGLYTFKVTGIDAEEYDYIDLYRVSENGLTFLGETVGETQMTYPLQAGESYLYRMIFASEQPFSATIARADTETLPDGPITDLSESGKWFTFTPEETAWYMMAGDEDVYVRVCSSDYEWINDYSDTPCYHLEQGHTYYVYISGESGVTITMQQIEATELSLGTETSASTDGWFSFTAPKNKLYEFLLNGSEEPLYEDVVAPGDDWDYCDDERSIRWRPRGKEGSTILLQVGEGCSVTPVESKTNVKSIQWESQGCQEFASGNVDITGRVQIVYEEGMPEEYRLSNEEECEDERSLSCLRSTLYEMGADGKPEYEKRISVEFTDDDDNWWGSYVLSAGIYAWVVEIGYYDYDYQFVRLDTVDPLIMPIYVDQHKTHTFKTVTEKAATCGAPGRTVSQCTVCGYKDPSSVRTIAATGRHTGGTATCVKKAVCKVCGKEYGSLAPSFIKLNASSLSMKVKQNTTKLTVSMGVGDSIASVKSSNTKILKAALKNGKITLTAQKKAGSANLTIALASGQRKTIKVKVQKKAVTTKSISGVSKKITLKKKQKTTLQPKLNPITSQDKIKYSSSNKKVVTVSSKGVVTAKKAGNAKITIRAGKKTFKCTITVK